MELILVRHAEAAAAAGGIESDYDRPLTPHGRAQAAALAEALKRHGVAAGAVVTSPLVRAVQTAEPLTAALTPGRNAVVSDWLANDGLRPKKLSRAVAELGVPSAVLVGHMPTLGDYAAWLLGAANGVDFEKAAAASIAVGGAIGKGAGVLRWLVPPEWFMPPT